MVLVNASLTLNICALRVTTSTHIGNVCGPDRRLGIQMMYDVMSSMTVFTGRGKTITTPYGFPVEGAHVLFVNFTVAGAAIDRFEFILVRKVLRIDIEVAHDAVEFAMN